MEFLKILSISLILISILCFILFFLWQSVECGRSPIEIFLGPLSNSEFKIFLDYVESTEITYEQKSLDKHWYIGKRYTLIKRFVNDRFYLNGVGLSFFQEKALIRAINRNALKANLLTPAGQVLYGNKK